MKNRRLYVPLLLLAMLALFFASAFVQPEDPSDLFAVLAWLAAGPGALFVAGYAVSFLLESVPGWGSTVPEGLRPWLVLAIAVALSFGAQVALKAVPSGILGDAAAIYKTLFLIVSTWVGSQLGYGRAKALDMRAPRVKRYPPN